MPQAATSNQQPTTSFPIFPRKCLLPSADVRTVSNEVFFHAIVGDGGGGRPAAAVADRRTSADERRSGAERRRSLRQAHPTVATVTRLGIEPAHALQVMVINVSLHGVGFRSPVSFEEGAVYRIRIGTGPLHLESRVRIVSSRQRVDGLHDVGGEFV